MLKTRKQDPVEPFHTNVARLKLPQSVDDALTARKFGGQLRVIDRHAETAARLALYARLFEGRDAAWRREFYDEMLEVWRVARLRMTEGTSDRIQRREAKKAREKAAQ
jgi:hypothetical protein